MASLAADTSVLIDLGRADLCGEVFTLRHGFLVPDYLYQTELADDLGPTLLALGLQIVSLGAPQVEAATVMQRANSGLSLSDAFVLVLAKERNAEVLTGDAVMRRVAAEQRLVCRGVLWLLDAVFAESPEKGALLHAGLVRLAGHPRCRLPRGEIEQRLNQYRRP
jgi:hypothetical protein